MTTPAHQFANSIRLPKWLRWSIYGITLWLILTGVAWLVAHYWLRTPGEFGETISPLEPWMLRLHGMAMMISLFLYGSLLRVHFIKAWQARRNRATGIAAILMMFLLVISGYLLYYAGDEELRPYISMAHWLIGLAVVAVFPGHVWYGRKLQGDLLKRVRKQKLS